MKSYKYTVTTSYKNRKGQIKTVKKFIETTSIKLAWQAGINVLPQTAKQFKIKIEPA